MSESKWHISPATGKAAVCVAERRCRFGGKHYDNVAEAEKAAEEKAALFEAATQKISAKKKLFASLSPKERDRLARDERQKGNTTYHQLLKAGVTEAEIDEDIHADLPNREAGLGLLSIDKEIDENAQPIVGLIYTGDYRAEEEYGLAAISKALENGSFPYDRVTYEEGSNGKSILVIPNPDERRYRPEEATARAKSEALHRFNRPYRNDIPFNVRLKVDRMKVTELRAELKGKVKPLPAKRDELEKAYYDLHYPLKKQPTVGEFHSGQALVIVGNTPAAKATMKQTFEAAQNKTLKMGSSSNPFSRGVLFYDDRDLSRKQKDHEIALNKAQEDSYARVASVKEKLAPKNGGFNSGRVYALKSNAGVGTKPGTEKYFLNYSLPDREQVNGERQISGWFSQADLEKIANRDYSPYVEKEKAREKEIQEYRAKKAAEEAAKAK